MADQSGVITILGTGIWGSTLSQLAVERGHQVRCWNRQLGLAAISELVTGSDLVISAVAMAGVPTVAAVLGQFAPQIPLVSATKGLDPITLGTPTQLWQAHRPHSPVAVLSGPNLAKEIQQGLPAAAVVAAQDPAVATQVQQLLSSRRFRLYTHSDPIGVELGGILKNVFAIATGVCDGLELGSNAKAALITRSLREMIRFGIQRGAQPETFSGLSGLGDLLATCNSPLSRNYRVGFGLGQQRSLASILAQIEGTAEGVTTAPVVVALAHQAGILMPICEQVNQVLLGQATPQEALLALVQRDPKPEWLDT